MSTNKKSQTVSSAVRVVALMLVITGVAYPLVVFVIGQATFPFQSNGSMVTLDNGNVVGSSLIAQEFQSPKFFHPRAASESTSGVDPHITPEDAFGQIERVSQATGIPQNHLQTLVQLNIQTNRVNNLSAFAPEYVNVLELNLELVRQYPEIYAEFLEMR